MLYLAWASPLVALDPEREVAQFTIDTWGEHEGLPGTFVYTIQQTHDGYLWLGTRRGLVRFDGVRFTVYDDRRPELRDSEVVALAEDDDGSLWIATHGGWLSRLRDSAFTSYSLEEGHPGNTITSLAKSPGGPLWIGTVSGLVAFDGRRFETYTTEHGLPSNSVTVLHRDGRGTLWIGTSRGLASYADGRLVNHAARHPGLGGTIRAIAGGGDGAIWLDRILDEDAAVGNPVHGVRRYEDGAVSVLTVADGLPSDEVTALLEDERGVVWIGTAAGLCRYRRGRLESFQRDPLTGANRNLAASHPRSVQCLQLDREGSLWIGTRLTGLARLRDAAFSTVVDGGTSSVVEDASGAIWVAGVSGLSRIRDGAMATMVLPDSLVPLVLAEDGARRLWVGTTSGVFWVDSGRVQRALPSLSDVAVSVLFTDDRGNVWIGGRTTGLYRWRDGALKHFTPQQGLLGSQVRAVAQDSAGAIWIGTKDGGISRLQDGRFHRLGIENGLPSPSVSALFVDAADQVWAATRRGLVRVHGTQIVTLTEEQGLPANYFYQVLSDGSGGLWLTFAGGIARFARRELDDVADGRATEVGGTVYGIGSGLRNTAMTVSFQPTACRSRDGRMWFATGDGAAVLDPGQTLHNEIPPPVVVEQVRTDGRRRLPSEMVEVPPGRGELEVQYTALSLLEPSRVLFRYRLLGFDREWVDAGTRRTAYYTNLPPGRYRFQVIACNNDGVWNQQGAHFDLRLLPHFYQTFWFYGACVVGVALAGIAAHRFRVRRLREQARELARRVEEAVAHTRILRGLIPVCAWCKKIRDDDGYWNQMETYIHEHSEADFSHSICPECAARVRSGVEADGARPTIRSPGPEPPPSGGPTPRLRGPRGRRGL